MKSWVNPDFGLDERQADILKNVNWTGFSAISKANKASPCLWYTHASHLWLSNKHYVRLHETLCFMQPNIVFYAT